MPSVLLPSISGGTNILSGNYFSGQGVFHPVGGIQLLMHPANSGIVYVALSGGVTITSGVSALSGSIVSGLGHMDGIPLAAGAAYFIPKLAFPAALSGSPAVFCAPDASCSGTARVCWEVY